ncbi:hypothetical protein ACI2J4_01235 [Agrobacterium tumefaciens]|uniref:hypothetical protein n=1 Tax=Agrobacterium tumefaciens TaxID=358 RepID=UPI00384B6ACF
MTQTLIGLDYAGVPCIKITKGNLDPITTPDGTLGAFLFNSKDTIQTKLSAVEITSNGDSITPPGAGTSNFGRYRYEFQGKWHFYYYAKSYFPGLEYDVPLFDLLPKDPSGSFYKIGAQFMEKFGYGERTEWVHLSAPGSNQGEAGWKTNYAVKVDSYNGRVDQTYPGLLHFVNVNSNDGRASWTPYLYNDVVVWNLPGNNVGLPSPSVVQPGLNSIRIDSSGLKIAKPGFDVDTATEAQLAISSNQRPMKIIAADDVLVPSGNSDYWFPVQIPPGSVCDVQYYEGGTLYYPGLPRQAPIGANLYLYGDHMTFVNPGGTCRARFIIIASDKVSQTSGNNEVMRQFQFNNENVVQFLRPGAGNPPSFSDVVLDSRWPALRIIKEGYFSVNPGAQVTNIPINTEGYFPFIKFMAVCAGRNTIDTAGDVIDSYTSNVRPPRVGMFRVINQYGGAQDWTPSGDTTYAEVTANNVAFKTFRGAPLYYFWSGQTDYQNVKPTYRYPDEVLGIRYYIFGIPRKD